MRPREIKPGVYSMRVVASPDSILSKEVLQNGVC